MGVDLASSSYMEMIANSVFRNDNQAVFATGYSSSGENDTLFHVEVTDCGNNSTTKCIYLSPSASGDFAIAYSSIDDAQQYFDTGNYDVVLLKEHVENSNVVASAPTRLR